MNAAARSRPARRRRLLVALVLMVAPLLAACEDAESEFFLPLAADWAVEKNLLTLNCRDAAQTDCEPELNMGELTSYTTLGRVEVAVSGDRGLGAALDAPDVMKVQEEADRLAADGIQQASVHLIDQAIKLRPDDWSYHEQRAAVLLLVGNREAAQAAQAASETLVQERIGAGASCQPLMLNMLRHRENALAKITAPHTYTRDQLQAVQNDIADLEDGDPSPWCP